MTNRIILHKSLASKKVLKRLNTSLSDLLVLYALTYLHLQSVCVRAYVPGKMSKKRKVVKTSLNVANVN